MFVETLVVFICTTSLEFFNVLDETAKIPFHRYFIIPDDNIRNTTELSIKSTDSFLYMNIKNIDYNFIQRLVVAYSTPNYENIAISKKNQNINFFSITSSFNEINYFDNEEFLGFTRRQFVFDGQKQNKAENKSQKIDDYDFIENISLALDGQPVSEKMFMMALEEILPLCKIDFDRSSSNLDKEIVKLISSKNHQSSSTVYQVFYEILPAELRNKIIFTKDELDVYSYVIRRTDGLKCFII